MIIVRKAEERSHETEGGHDSWVTFGATGTPKPHKFGSLEVFRERRLIPRSAIREPRQEAEVITYVREGSLAFEDSLGQTGVIRRDEFQRMTVGTDLRYREMNVSPVHGAHLFQIWLRPGEVGFAAGHEQKRFGLAERKGRMRLVASPDGAHSSLTVHQDAHLYSGILHTGQHVVHALGKGHGAWIHVVAGSVDVCSRVLVAGDGAGITEEVSVSLRIREPSELLLLDLGELSANLHLGDGIQKGGRLPRTGGNGSSLLVRNLQ